MMFTRKNPRNEEQSAQDRGEFERFYQEQLPRVYNFFRYRFTDEGLAEDLTAMTFEKAWKNRQRYRKDLSAFSTWLFTIARRIAIDMYRKRKPDDVPLEDIYLELRETSPEDLVQNRQNLAHLRQHLLLLTEKERECVALKYGAGLTNREIARLMGMSESNAGVILFRSLQKLREMWEKANE